MLCNGFEHLDLPRCTSAKQTMSASAHWVLGIALHSTGTHWVLSIALHSTGRNVLPRGTSPMFSIGATGDHHRV